MTLYHPRLPHALIALRPGARTPKDFICRDDGDGLGPYLVDGSMINPPTQAEVDALTEQQLDAAQLEKAMDWVGDQASEQILYDHENRLRATEGRPPLGADEFKKLLVKK